jgi:hypothetical protein
VAVDLSTGPHDGQGGAPILRGRSETVSASSGGADVSPFASGRQLAAEREAFEQDGPVPPQISPIDRSTISAVSIRDRLVVQTSKSIGEMGAHVLASDSCLGRIVHDLYSHKTGCSGYIVDMGDVIGLL